MKTLKNLENITLHENGELTYNKGWLLIKGKDQFFHPSYLLPPIPESNVSLNDSDSEKFLVRSHKNRPFYLMRAMLKETVVTVPKETTVFDGETITIPEHKKTILSWDFEAKEYKRFAIIYSPFYNISFSKDFHILLDGEMKEFYSENYKKMYLVSVPNDGRILVQNNHFYISPVNFEF